MSDTATKVGHTAGPWTVTPTPSRKGNYYIDAGSEPIGMTSRMPEGLGTAEANARLIAAAPDLLEVCKAFVARHAMGDVLDQVDYSEVRDMAERAIRNAEGGKP